MAGGTWSGGQCRVEAADEAVLAREVAEAGERRDGASEALDDARADAGPGAVFVGEDALGVGVQHLPDVVAELVGGAEFAADGGVAGADGGEEVGDGTRGCGVFG